MNSFLSPNAQQGWPQSAGGCEECQHKPSPSTAALQAGTQPGARAVRSGSHRLPRLQGPWAKHWSLKVPEKPAGTRKSECKEIIFIFSVLTRLRTGVCDWWANKHHNKLQEDLKTWTLEAQGLPKVSCWTDRNLVRTVWNGEKNSTGLCSV